MLVLNQALWGFYRPPGAGQAALPLELELGARHAERFLRERRLELTGRLWARELATASDVAGTLWLGSPRAPLRYELEFRAAGQGTYRLNAEVVLDWGRPILSLSTLTGTLVTPAGARSGVELRYDYRRDLQSLLHWE